MDVTVQVLNFLKHNCLEKQIKSLYDYINLLSVVVVKLLHSYASVISLLIKYFKVLIIAGLVIP